MHPTVETSLQYPTDKVIFEKLDIIQYKDYESIIWGKLGTISTQIDQINYLGHNEGILDQVPEDGMIYVYYAFQDFYTEY